MADDIQQKKREFIARFRLYKGANYAGGWQVSTARNLTLTGCSLTSDASLKVGDFIEIEVQLPLPGRHMRFIGEIDRMDSHTDKLITVYTLDVTFVRIDEVKKEEFIKLMQSFQQRGV